MNFYISLSLKLVSTKTPGCCYIRYGVSTYGPCVISFNIYNLQTFKKNVVFRKRAINNRERNKAKLMLINLNWNLCLTLSVRPRSKFHRFSKLSHERHTFKRISSTDADVRATLLNLRFALRVKLFSSSFNIMNLFHSSNPASSMSRLVRLTAFILLQTDSWSRRIIISGAKTANVKYNS